MPHYAFLIYTSINGVHECIQDVMPIGSKMGKVYVQSKDTGTMSREVVVQISHPG